MNLYVSMYHFETSQPRELAAFWSRLLDIPVDDGASDDLAMIDAAHQHRPVTWIFQRTTEGAATGAQRLTLDLTDDSDWEACLAHAINCGAEQLSINEVGGVRWGEFHDPDGNVFRIFAPRPVEA